MLILRVHADIGVTQSELGRTEFPVVRVRITPWSGTFNFVSFRDGLYGEFQALPMVVGRDIRIDEESFFRISVIGVKAGVAHHTSQDFAWFAQLAIEALGYKRVELTEGAGEFKGFRPGSVTLELGTQYRINRQAYLRLTLGVAGDVNSGSIDGRETEQVDSEAYVVLRTDISRALELLMKWGTHSNCLSLSSDCRSAPQLVVGAVFSF